MSRPAPPARQDFPFFRQIATRWIDNDQYGHVNNVVYYAYIDTLISEFLIGIGGLDVDSGPVIGVCAENGCRYLKSIAHPETIDAGLRIARLGSTSVTYETGLFKQGDNSPAAFGFFVHVFVDRATNHPTPIPPNLRREMESLVVPSRVLVDPDQAS